MPGKQRPKPRLTKKEKKAQLMNLVNKASSATNILSDFQEWTTYKKHDLDLKISYSTAADLEAGEINLIFDLLRRNMEEFYLKSDWGWDSTEKMNELTAEWARYLLMKDTDGKLIGFSLFRFDVDNNYPVLYTYELQLEPDYQRKGLGRFVMNLLTLMAFKFKMVKVVLTVFHQNLAAINFYVRTLNFRRDETSPYQEEGKCYIILCKIVDENEVRSIKM